MDRTSITVSLEPRLAWQRFIAGYRVVTESVERELMRAGGLTLREYEVLVRLQDAPGHQLRFLELSKVLLVSQSGVSKLVNRLIRRGLLERLVTDSNNRDTFAVLTDAGRQLQESVQPAFLAAFEAHFSRRLTDSDVAELL